ncbi:AMP-binding protein, partial [Klebsiella pneumoniae]|nr:AMP-binding protein [Klebsiella pneumoniae]
MALRLLDRRGGRIDLTYAELSEATNRFANVLARLGVEPGERVFVLSGRVAELYVAVLGALKARTVACPLFSAFGPEPIRQRMEL